MAAPESWACVSHPMSRNQPPIPGVHMPLMGGTVCASLCPAHPVPIHRDTQSSPSHKSSCLLAPYHFPRKADFHEGIHQVLLVTLKAKDLLHIVHYGIIHWGERHADHCPPALPSSKPPLPTCLPTVLGLPERDAMDPSAQDSWEKGPSQNSSS